MMVKAKCKRCTFSAVSIRFTSSVELAWLAWKACRYIGPRNMSPPNSHVGQFRVPGCLRMPLDCAKIRGERSGHRPLAVPKDQNIHNSFASRAVDLGPLQQGHCQLHGKASTDALPLRQPDGVRVAKI